MKLVMIGLVLILEELIGLIIPSRLEWSFQQVMQKYILELITNFTATDWVLMNEVILP